MRHNQSVCWINNGDVSESFHIVCDDGKIISLMDKRLKTVASRTATVSWSLLSNLPFEHNERNAAPIVNVW